MKRFLCFIVLCFIIVLLIFPFFGCSTIKKSAYQMIHDTSAVDPDKLSGVSLIYKEDKTILSNVIDLEYDKDATVIHYVRRDTDGKYIKGIAPYNKIDIRTKDGTLFYDKDEWYYKNLTTNKTYLVNQDNYREIVVSGEDPQK